MLGVSSSWRPCTTIFTVPDCVADATTVVRKLWTLKLGVARNFSGRTDMLVLDRIIGCIGLRITARQGMVP